MAFFHTQKRFFEALAHGDIDTVRRYLAKNNTWAVAQNKATKQYPLHVAAQAGHLEILDELLRAGAPAWRNDDAGRIPLHLAAASGRDNIVRKLLDSDNGSSMASQDSNGLTPLHHAVLGGHMSTLKLFLETKKADLTAGRQPLLYFAAANNSKEAVDILLAAGADPNAPLVQEVYDYDEDEYFGYHYQSRPRKSHTNYYSPLNCACSYNNVEIAVALIAAGAKKRDGEFPLHMAASNGNMALMKALIANGHDVHALNSARQNLLHVASMKGHTDIVRFLLEKGVKKDALDDKSRSPLSYAQQYAMTDVVSLLRDPAKVQAEFLITPSRPAVTEKPPVEARKPPPAPVFSDGEIWSLSGRNSIAHVQLLPGLERKLTEIFNFETRERITISENLALKTETMGPHESFDAVSDAALRRAYAEFTRRGGAADEDAVFGPRLMKMRVNLPKGSAS